MSDGFDLEAMISRFQDRARAVKDRSLPPVEGAERARFAAQAKQDLVDFALIGDAVPSVEDGEIVLRIKPRA